LSKTRGCVSTTALQHAIKEVQENQVKQTKQERGQKPNVQKTKYMLLSHHLNAEQNRDIKIVKCALKMGNDYNKPQFDSWGN
jgi:hypothetical protein